MRVLVASQNKIKAAATHEAFARFLGQAVEVVLAPDEISSGVNDQPLTQSEAATGADNRLKAIVREPGFDYFVAIEGGVYAVTVGEKEYWYESACAAVTAADNTEPVIAFGPAYPVPNRFIAHLKEGRDLNQIMESETGIKEAGKGMGFNGWLTSNQIDRQKSSAEAVLLALHGLNHQ